MPILETEREEDAKMQIEVKIDGAYKEPKVVIWTDAMTGEIEALIKRLSSEQPSCLAGIREQKLRLLEPEDIWRVYTAGQKVLAQTPDGEYVLRLRLYEAEERLPRSEFLRISHGEIINMRKVKNFDISLAGTICVTLLDGTMAYASRRYVSKIKRALGI